MTVEPKGAKPGQGQQGSGQPESAVHLPDPALLAQHLARVAERSQRVTQAFLERTQRERPQGIDPLNLGRAFTELTLHMMAEPQRLWQAQMALWTDYLRLWEQTSRRLMGEPAQAVAEPVKGDKRFNDPAWQENAVFDYLKQSYLLAARWIQTQVADVKGMDPKDAHKVVFYTRQFVDAMAPSNFAATNPTVLKETFASGGENLIKGLENLLHDLERGRGSLLVSMTDMEAFRVGENLATTPGKIVFENDLMQLIQYAPTTETVLRRPLLIIPPWINKYYILDMRPENSFIRWAVGEGLTVFVVSWVNPDSRLAQKSFEDYMDEGVYGALDAIERITGEREVNAIGYCLGGTLLAATLAVMTAKGDRRINSATYFTALVDFKEAGDVTVFIDDEQIARLEQRMAEQGGVLDAEALHTSFNLLRSNDLIWSFVVNNYLMGREPLPFDLLYWNSDSTRMPQAMHSFYLRRMYKENRLSQPGGLVLKGVPIDLRTIDRPTVIVSCREDHIAPWKSTYVATQLYQGPVDFILAASGHIAGIVNPPAARKYNHWVHDGPPPADPEAWLAGARAVPGSWWPEWRRWLEPHGGGTVPAREPGGGAVNAIEDAPGRYVRERAIPS